MTLRFQAQWSDDIERRLYNGANGRVDDLTADKKGVCFTANMETAERVAASLNLHVYYSTTQLQKMAAQLEK